MDMKSSSGTKTETDKRVTPPKDEMVRVRDYIPDIGVDLRYATDENFTGEVIYNFSDAYLRYGTVEKLAAVQDRVKRDGYFLKIWDAFRPVEAQFALWDVLPDSTYVADPYRGYSAHSKGNAVDITLTRTDETEIPMPTGLDDFSSRADRDYSDCTEEEAANAMYLEEIMEKNGFIPYFSEWWHFSDTDNYDVAEDIKIPPDKK